MKKRILTLLLAGLMAMSAVACNNTAENPGTTDPNATDPIITDADGYQAVNETVYALVDELNLRTAANTSATSPKQVSFATEMTRIKYSKNWSVVVLENTEYYVMSDYLTTDDLGLKSFTAVSPERVMHAITEGVNVRSYPTAHYLANEKTFVKKLIMNDLITVTAENESWYQIRMDGKKYYVSKDYFEEGDVPSLADLGDFEGKFERDKFTTPKKMTLNSNGVNLRKYPSSKAYSQSLGSYSKGMEVTVLSITTINTEKWAQVQVLTDPGDPASAAFKAYIRADFLSNLAGVDNTKFETLISHFDLEEYTTPKKMWASADLGTTPLTVRSTPTTEDDNKVGKIYKGDEVTVYAEGKGNYAEWYLIKFSDDDTAEGYYFVSANFITLIQGGATTPKANDYEKYDSITACTPVTKTVVAGGAYRYLAPELGTDNKYSDPLAAGTTVTVLAKGTYGSNYSVYFIKDSDGNFWYIDQNKVQ